jgi:hypothetical protein
MRAIVAFFSLLIAAGSLFAATLETKLNPTTARVGDTLRLDLQIQGVGGRPVSFSKPTDPFALLKTDSSGLASGRIGFTVAVYDTGHHVLKDMPVLVGRGASAETLHTAAVAVDIQSILPDTAQTPLPLKPYRKHPFQWREIYGWLWIPGLIALVIAGWWLWKRYFKRGAAILEAKIPLLPPDQEAVRNLLTLKERKYPSRGMLKEFFSEYSQIMRRYLERRYGFPALEMTTWDLARTFEEQSLPKPLTARLLPSLREADLVKFAKYIPELKDCDASLDLGFELVELTKPLPESAPVAEEKAA